MDGKAPPRPVSRACPTAHWYRRCRNRPSASRRFRESLTPASTTSFASKTSACSRRRISPARATRCSYQGGCRWERHRGRASVTLQVPLSTYTGWNQRRGGIDGKRVLRQLEGAHFPFAKTAAERGGDPRPSLQERYGSQAGYVAKVEEAAQKLVSERLFVAGRCDANRSRKHGSAISVSEQVA